MEKIITPSILKDKITIITGFFSVLLLLFILVSIAMMRIDNNKIQLTKITNDLSNIKDVHIMRSAIHNRALILYRMARTKDSFERDDMYMEFRDNASVFLKSSYKISENLFRQHETDLYTESNKSIRLNARAQNKAVDDILAGKIDAAYHLLEKKIIPIQQDVSQQLTILTLSLQNNANNAITDLSILNDDSNFLLAIIGSIAITLGLFITFFVTKRISISEKAFIEQQILAEDANKAKTMFLATMSHEIRSPLSAIIGFSDLLQTEKMTQNKSVSCLESIQRNSKHLLQLINNILDITKIEADQLKIEKINVSPFSILDEFQSTIAMNAKDKGLGFKINYAFPLPQQIQTDPIRLKQILINLASNAIKFTSEGEISMYITYDHELKKMTFNVIDSGIGLTLKQQEKIFDSFTQADSSTTRQFGGSGLGLRICKQLVQKLGGDIVVESTPGRGSKFSFNIDTGTIINDNLVYSLEECTTHCNSTKFNPIKKIMGKILLAEDTEDNQVLIEMYVTNTGASITIVDNGAEAVKICATQQFDLILMDMQMPVMDGVEATKKIRLLNPNIPIIVLTANALKSDFENCIDAGANEFLTKPIDIIRFNQTLYKYLSNPEEPVLTSKNKE